MNVTSEFAEIVEKTKKCSGKRKAQSNNRLHLTAR